MIPKETIDRIFAASKIEEVVGDYVKLHRRGANLIGLCPFHNEKTGSFTVSPSKSIFKCFGCGKSGNAVGFIMEHEQCTYVEALRYLANKYHITIEDREMTEEEKQHQDDRESMFIVNEVANQWFQDQLWNTQEGQAIGLSYLRHRGLREDIIRKFQLGYSPEKADLLPAYLKKSGYQEKYFLNDPETKIGVGLCGKSSHSDRLYDRLHDRVIFPIFTLSGKVVAFAGRIMKPNEKVGKYINSPDSIVYSKTNELYGFSLAKQAIAQKDLCYMVEGQMDVISLHQAGIENVVASGGTALTKPQIRMIKRFTSNITVLYDSDGAGIHAAMRGIDMFLDEGFNVKVVRLPDGEDPDSFAQSHNSSDLLEYMRTHQLDFIRYKMDLLYSEEATDNDPHKRAELIQDITRSISYISDRITRQVYMTDVAEHLHINESVLLRTVTEMRRQRAQEAKAAADKANSQDTSAAVATPIVEEVTKAATPMLVTQQQKTDALEENILNLLQVLVRYGDHILGENDEGQLIRTGDYILSELEAEEIHSSNPVYQAIIDEYKKHCTDSDFCAETFFKYHPDPKINQLAIELIADKYQLSAIYSRQCISENVVQEVAPPTDADRLFDLVNQLLLELKFTIVNRRIERVDQALREASKQGDWDLQCKLLTELPALTEVKNMICQQLGHRVIMV